jgi:hypothetical protein
MAKARADECICYEQDWLVQIWQGVRQLREVPGRIREWQEQLNRAAEGVGGGMGMIWCVATHADMCVAAVLSQVVAVRTCDDYRYAEDPSVLRRWHLTTSCIVRALGLWAFKDVFISEPKNESGVVDIDGDSNAELEAALSALSAGPVGIGDRVGRTNRRIVMRTCCEDGMLVKPDVPLALLDRSLLATPEETPLLWADTVSGAWRYVLVLHAGKKSDKAYSSATDRAVCERLEVVAGGTPRLLYNWRTGAASVCSHVKVELRTHEWALFVVCPPPAGPERMTVMGNVAPYATMGQRHVRAVLCEELEVLGVEGEAVHVPARSAELGLRVKEVTIPASAPTRVELRTAAWASDSFDTSSLPLY